MAGPVGSFVLGFAVFLCLTFRLASLLWFVWPIISGLNREYTSYLASLLTYFTPVREVLPGIYLVYTHTYLPYLTFLLLQTRTPDTAVHLSSTYLLPSTYSSLHYPRSPPPKRKGPR
ncbi:hypothetical protein LY76DRAFT_279595 [Colletotrichum caudatum]|nr:hypothetical protein LY76DRAFT_279595 [Colletotrichum caudatum]